MTERSIILYIVLLLILPFVSCTEDVPKNKGEISDYEKGLTVLLATRDGEEGEADDEESDGEDIEMPSSNIFSGPYYNLKFLQGDAIYISQHSTKVTAFQKPSDQSNSNLNIYYYGPLSMEEDNATWEDGFNFLPDETGDTSNALSWETVLNNGTFGNAFQMFGLFFPAAQNAWIPTDDEGNGSFAASYGNTARSYFNEINTSEMFAVQTDQSTIENLVKSDILGAYHATSALYTRLRFMLHHLMTYVRVTLYVPVSQLKEVNGMKVTSGYGQDACVSALVKNANTKFGISWTALRTSDYNAPLVEPVTGESQEQSDISMYSEPYAPETSRPQTEINVKDFLPENFPDQGLDGNIDQVYIYNYDVFFPQSQPFNESGITNVPFMHFTFRNDAGVEKTYQFVINNTTSSGGNTMNLTQGQMSRLYLYLPRVGDEAILVTAEKKPWTDSNAGMNLNPVDDEGDTGND